MSYYELWNVVSQWKRQFTVREFASTFVSPDPHKVLHDMSRKGLLQRAGWGQYQVTSQAQYVKLKHDVSAAYELVKRAGLPHCFTGPDAVFIWTKGGYNADRFFGFYPVMLNVRKADVPGWRRFFRSAQRTVVTAGKPVKQTLFGVFYVLWPVKRLDKAEVAGFSVEPLSDAVKFCQRNIYTYEPALEMLDQMYGLGLGARYSESSA
jgi:hypothetical protein